MTAGFNLGDLLERQAQLRPQATAINCAGVDESFSLLLTRARRLANGLIDLGVAPGDRVCLAAGNCHKVAELYWACALLGAAAVPIELRLTAEEAQYIVDTTRPKAAFVESSGRLSQLVGLEPVTPVVLLESERSPDTGLISYEDLVIRHEPEPLPPVDTDTAVLVMYTAATSGKPRGAMITHRNLITQYSQTSEAFGLSECDRHGVFLPMTHTFGAFLMFVTLCRGMANTMLPAFDPDHAVRLIAEGKVNFYAEFAPMGARILEAAARAKVRLGNHLRIATGLEVPETINGYLSAGVEFHCIYGQTETSGIVTAGAVLTGNVRPNYSGKPMSLSHLSLRRESGEAAGPGEIGELWVRSECVVREYFPGESTNIVAGAWLKTGDLLQRTEEGDFYFAGRVGARDLIKPGGLNVYPAEVEEVIAGCAKVKAVAVFGRPDPVWREKVCAVVATDFDQEQVRGEIEGLCVLHLASFKRPAVIVIDNSLLVGGVLDAGKIAERYGDL